MPLFSVLMFMMGPTAAATRAAEGQPLGERGSLPAPGGLLTSPWCHRDNVQMTVVAAFPQNITQKGTEDNWICVYNLCILLGFSNFGNAMMTLECPWRSGGKLPRGPQDLPFGTKNQRAEREDELGTMSALYLKSCVMKTNPSVFGKSGIIRTANIYTESQWFIRLYVVIPTCFLASLLMNEYLGWARPG